MTSKEQRTKIIEHYDTNTLMFKLFWSPDYLRYGLWDSSTKNLREALTNTDRTVASILGVNKEDLLLDAGCGVGATARFMAQTYGSKITGINISELQLDIAKKKAANEGLEKLIDFENEDFTNTTFPNEHFSKAYAIESVYHVENPKLFTDEIYRILKKEGKVCIVDRFLVSNPITQKQIKQSEKYMKGQAVSNLHTLKDIFNSLKHSGFKEISYHDRKNEAMKCVNKSTEFTKISYPLFYIANKLGLASKEILQHGESLINIKKLFENGIMTYGCFSAKK